MNKVYLYSKNDISSLIKLIFCLFIPFAFYGLYKNGIILYQNNLVSRLLMFKPLFFILISIIISFIFSKINKKRFINYELLINIIIAMVVSINTNLIVYIVLLTIINVIHKFLKFNTIPIFMLIDLLILFIMKKPLYLNAFEISVKHNYSLIDYIIGKGYGGACNTLLIMSILSWIILSFNINYKRQIPVMALSTYYILLIITSFITGNFDMNLLLNSNLLFAVIFICPITLYSPYLSGGCYIFGLITGLLLYLISFINVDYGIYIVIIVLSFSNKLFDKLIVNRKKIKRT